MRRRLAALGLAACAAAGAAQQPQMIRFGLTADYPPFAARAEDGALTGADVAAARRIAADAGAQAKFVLTSWPALEADFAAGRFDVAIGGLSVTPARAALGTFSVALLDDGKRPLARCAEARRYRTLAAIDRPGVRVQINRGPQIAVLARDWFHRAAVAVNRDDADLTAALLDRRADVWITDGVVVDHMARRFRGRLCATTSKPFTHVTKAWLIRRDPALVALIDRGLKEALRRGTWRRALRAAP